MPRKEFVAFTRLDASDVNTYLMDQSVMTFASSAARGSAIATPVEGMVTYLEDSNSLQLYDGDGWTSAGGVSSGNAIINGAFEINQRGFTSGTVGGTFPFDRWVTDATGDGTTTFSAQTFTPGAAPVAGYEGTNFLRLVTTGQTSSSVRSSFTQRIENVRTFAGETVTLSFFAKSGSGTPKLALEMFQNFGSGGSANVFFTGQQVTISSSWTRYSATFSAPSISGKTIGANNNLSLNIFVSAGSNLDARTGSLGIQSNTFDIWGVQLEAGSVPTPFRRNANSIQAELAACQRYYYRLTPGAASVQICQGFAKDGDEFIGYLPLPVTMRRVPTSSETSSTFTKYQLNDQTTSINLSNLLVFESQSTQNSAFIYATVSSGLTGFRPYVLQTSGTGSDAFIGFSAEL